MPTERYVYKSNVLKERYLDDQIDYETYAASLEALKNEELRVIALAMSSP